VRTVARVGIVTDSTVCLPEALVERYAIRVVPLDLVFDGKVYRDGVDISPEVFYQLLQRARKLPTTSPASPGDYLKVYQELSRGVDSILCITVSSKVSAMFDAAQAAKEAAAAMMPQTTIQVLDSSTAAMAQGFVVLRAAEAAAQGQDLDQVAQVAQGIMSRVHLIASVDTLCYLAKGGRVPKLAAWASSLLRIKPIAYLFQGEVSLVATVRTSSRSRERLVEIVRQRVAGAPVHVAIFHAHAGEEAEELKRQISSRLQCAELYVTQFTPVMGAHTGPGVLGLAFYNRD
jgi:DegV family protein with EDD domain